jgi:hypothetical protein
LIAVVLAVMIIANMFLRVCASVTVVGEYANQPLVAPIQPVAVYLIVPPEQENFLHGRVIS